MVDGQDLMRQIASAGARIDPGLSDRDVDRIVVAAHGRRRRRTARRVAVAGGSVLALALVLVVLARRSPTQPEVAANRKLPSPVVTQIVRLADGSSVAALDPATEIAVAEERADRVRLSLGRGRGRFDVAPRPARRFEVGAGDVTITVLGTLFTVERVADRVGVSVERGKVRVDWGAGSALLHKGESGWYPPLAASPPMERAAATEEAQPSTEATRAERSNTASHPTRPSKAPASSRESPPAPVAEKAESAEDLLLAADKARLAGQARQGADLLRKLLRDHGGDPRAPLAAFTLGRMLLMELAQPREAAAAFAQARRLAPTGPFAEDALAREVEALRRAGLAAEASARAQEYLRLYPSGRRAATVKGTGRVE